MAAEKKIKGKVKSKMRPRLQFGRSEVFVTGRFKDEHGNEFQIFISGLENKVENFIKYQKRKLKSGEFGIRVNVETLPGGSRTKKTSGPTSVSRTKEPDQVFNRGGVKIGIQRFRMVTPLPYKITYIIDPPLQSVGKNEDSPSGIFQLDFTNDTADVTCMVRLGTIQFQLLENGTRVDGPFMLPDPATSAITKTVTKNKTQANQDTRWQVIVQGIGQANNFELMYAKKFT